MGGCCSDSIFEHQVEIVKVLLIKGNQRLGAITNYLDQVRECDYTDLPLRVGFVHLFDLTNDGLFDALKAYARHASRDVDAINNGNVLSYLRLRIISLCFLLSAAGYGRGGHFSLLRGSLDNVADSFLCRLLLRLDLDCILMVAELACPRLLALRFLHLTIGVEEDRASRAFHGVTGGQLHILLFEAGHGKLENVGVNALLILLLARNGWGLVLRLQLGHGWRHRLVRWVGRVGLVGRVGRVGCGHRETLRWMHHIILIRCWHLWKLAEGDIVERSLNADLTLIRWLLSKERLILGLKSGTLLTMRLHWWYRNWM